MTHQLIRKISAIAAILALSNLAACGTTAAADASDKDNYVAGDSPTGSNISKRFNKTMAPSIDVLAPTAVLSSTAVATPSGGR